MIFYVIIFSAMAVLLVVAGLTLKARNRKQLDAERWQESSSSGAHRSENKAKRAQSRNARRKRK